MILALPRHVGVLDIKGKEFRLRKVPLKTVRPMYMEEVDCPLKALFCTLCWPPSSLMAGNEMDESV